MKDLEQILKCLEQPMLDMLTRWIAVPSVGGAAEDGAPFGRPVRDMLDMALADCAALGFDVKGFDGYAGHADMGAGEDVDALGILAHLDVVPVGDGWARAPFSASVENGFVYGRGACDDKGPALAALFAMRAVMLAGVPLKRKVRLIFGCDEENGMASIDYYKKAAVMPRSGFSPDADYPVINIEKGGLHVTLRADADNSGLRVLSFQTGERFNVVPGRASVLVAGGADIIDKVNAFAKAERLDITAGAEDGGVRISAKGVSGHAAMPQSARNAIGMLLLTLAHLGVRGPLAALARAVGMQYDGDALGIRVCDGVSGDLTCNMGIIRADEASVYATLDIRYPILASAPVIIKQIQAALPEFIVTMEKNAVPHHVPEQSELVQSLLASYTEVTGLPGRALAIGGGTYARALEEGVAFGIQMPGEPEMAHQADECVSVANLNNSMRIFAHAIIKLAGA